MYIHMKASRCDTSWALTHTYIQTKPTWHVRMYVLCKTFTAKSGLALMRLSTWSVHTHFKWTPTYTVDPLYSGHHRDPADCPVQSGFLNSEVVLYTALCGWDCRVSSLERCPLSRVTFIERFHCILYVRHLATQASTNYTRTYALYVHTYIYQEWMCSWYTIYALTFVDHRF